MSRTLTSSTRGVYHPRLCGRVVIRDGSDCGVDAPFGAHPVSRENQCGCMFR